MANAVKKFRGAPARGVTNEQLMRLVRFPAVRKAISGALERAVPEKVATHGGGQYVRFRIADPGSYHPALFATVPVGNRGTLLVIGTPKSEVKKPAQLAAFIRRMGRGLKTEARRSLIYQLRQAGIIGGSRTQAVLVPRSRVLSVAGQYARSAGGRAAANPILATIGFNPGRGATRNAYACYKCSKQIKGEVVHYVPPVLHTRLGIDFQKAFHPSCYKDWQAAAAKELGIKPNPRRAGRRNPLNRWESAQILRQGNADLRSKHQLKDALHRGLTAGRVQGRAADVMAYGPSRAKGAAVKVYERARNLAYKIRRRTVRPNSGAGAATVEIKVPFRDGQKITPARMRQWIDALPDNAITRLIRTRFEKGLAQYKRFHLGSEPTSFTYRAIPMGSQGSRITDVDMVVSEGKEWAAPYQVPKSSGKYDPKVDGRYIHAHGDSKMDIDITKAASTKKLPERFHTADGKFVGVVPSRNVKITDWYRG